MKLLRLLLPGIVLAWYVMSTFSDPWWALPVIVTAQIALALGLTLGYYGICELISNHRKKS